MKIFLSVTCSTPTVTKCQAALRTLQSFPFFKPICLCKVGSLSLPLLVTVTTSLLQEPRLDPDCNQFKDFLIDHPCLKAKHKGETYNFTIAQTELHSQIFLPETDPFPVSALPTCDHAEEVCSSDQVCSKKIDQFKRHCPVRGDRCVMTDV